MADNTQLNLGSGGDLLSTDDIGGGVKVERVKVQYGADGSATDVSATTPLPTRQNGTVATLSNVGASAASVTVLASNANRLIALLYNDSTSPCNIKYGATASLTSFVKRLLPGESFEVKWYTGIIDCIWDVANGNMRVTEVTP